MQQLMIPCILGRVFKYIHETFLDPLHPTEAKEIDYMVETILGRSVLRSSILGEYPRINFTRGFTRLTLLTASEKVGVLFAVYILLHTERGQEIMEKVLKRQQEKYLQPSLQDSHVEDTVPDKKPNTDELNHDMLDGDTPEVLKDKKNTLFPKRNGRTRL